MDNKVIQAGRYGSAIQADSNGDLPTRIEVMRAGSWPETSNKGMLYITDDDLQGFVVNFKNGVGVPGGTTFGQIPIDFSHEDYREAAGWITDLSVENGILYASVTWTTAGEAALKGGMYKCFSPSFWPACLGEWCDPEDWNTTATNVLVGGGLTNIPFFKDLTPIMASNAGNSKDSKITSNARKEIIVQTLDEVRIKEVASLTADDRKVLDEHKTELSAAEQAKFGYTTAPVAASAATGVSEADAKVLADIKAGNVKLVQASEYDGLKASVSKLEASVKANDEKEAKAFVTAQSALGKLPTSDIDKWTARVMADATIKADIEAMPAHEALKASVGSDEDIVAGTAAQELQDRIAEAVKADANANPQDVMKNILASDKDLVQRLKDERK